VQQVERRLNADIITAWRCMLMENVSADWMDLQAIVNTEVLMKSKNITTESLLYGLKI